jgi:hypothetical protein
MGKPPPDLGFPVRISERQRAGARATPSRPRIGPGRRAARFVPVDAACYWPDPPGKVRVRGDGGLDMSRLRGILVGAGGSASAARMVRAGAPRRTPMAGSIRRAIETKGCGQHHEDDPMFNAKVLRSIVRLSMIVAGFLAAATQLEADPLPMDDAAPAAVPLPELPVPKPRVPLGLPKRLSTTEIDLYCWILELTEAQEIAFQSIYDQFRLQETQFRKDYFSPLLQRATDILPTDGPLHLDPAAAAGLKSLHEDSERVARDLAVVERGLFARLEPLLAEHQKPKITEAWQARQRVHARSYPSAHPGWWIDLVVMLHALQSQGHLDASHNAAYRPVLTAYSAAVTPVVQACERETIKNCVEGGAFEAEMYPRYQVDPSNPDDAAHHAAILAELFEHRRRLRKHQFELADHIHELNVQYLARLTPLLPQRAAEELRRRFNEKAYYHVYPDAADIRDFCDQVRSLPGLDADQLEQIDTVIATYAASREQVSSMMVKDSMEWITDCFRTMHSVPTDFWKYQERMRDGNKRRAEQSLAALSGLREVCSAEQLRDIEDVFLTVEQAMRKEAESPAFPERPW